MRVAQCSKIQLKTALLSEKFRMEKRKCLSMREFNNAEKRTKN